MFRQIVQALVDDISANRLPVGARLPPHRDLADELFIARGTVARAYSEAEKLGLVRSEVGRGTHVLAPDGGARPYSSLLEPPTVLRDLSTNLPLSGIDPDPSDVLRQLADRPDRKALFRYLPPDGAPRHRLAAVRWFERMAVDATVEDVVLCAGAQHALFVLVSHLAARAPALYVEELTYPGMHGIAEVLGLPLIPVTMDSEGMTPSGLARAARLHGPGVVYCMPTIHNPKGSVMSSARRASIAELARLHGLFVVEDASNRMFERAPPPPIRHYAKERTFLVASVSKVLFPGLRIAFIVGPQSERAAVVRRVWATEWMVGPLGAEIVTMWLDDGVVDQTLQRKRREAARRQRLARRIFGSSRVIAHPHALHLWLRLPAHMSTEKFVANAALHHVAVTPSSAFWTRSTPPPDAVRIALGGVDDPRELEGGLRTIALFGRGAERSGDG
jgi:DNA-binding transcriptional MocR family regulator